jgi:hypothetical protein
MEQALTEFRKLLPQGDANKYVLHRVCAVWIFKLFINIGEILYLQQNSFR